MRWTRMGRLPSADRPEASSIAPVSIGRAAGCRVPLVLSMVTEKSGMNQGVSSRKVTRNTK